MPVQINLTLTLPDNKRSEQFAHRLSAALDRKPQPGLAPLTLEFTDANLNQAWKNCDREHITVEVPRDIEVTTTSQRAHLLRLLDKTADHGFLAYVGQFSEICQVIGLDGRSGAVVGALRAMTSPRNKTRYTSFPAIELIKVGADWNDNVFSLTQLKQATELNCFGTSYLSFRGGGPARLKLIHLFVDKLVQTGLFSDPS